LRGAASSAPTRGDRAFDNVAVARQGRGIRLRPFGKAMADREQRPYEKGQGIRLR